MKPILFITKMDGGGMETFCLGLLAALPDATLYTSYAGGVRDRDVPARVERVCWNVRAAKSFLRIATWLRTRPADPCFCLSQELCVVLVFLKRLRLIRNRIYFRESTDVERHYDARYWRMMRHVLPYCDGLVEQSHVGLEATRRLCGGALPKCLVVRNIATAGDSSLPAASGQVPFAPPSPASPRRLICPGSFKPMKGQLHLLQCLSSFSGFDFRLAFCGDGECRAACEKYVCEHRLGARVAFRDWQRDKAAIYDGADCVVIPSDYEGLPNVMLEAILHGVRVSVRPTCTGACELLREIGLPDTWPVTAAFAIPGEAWQSARMKLAEECEPARVAKRILDFFELNSTDTPGFARS